MKIRIFNDAEETEKVVWIPTGFLFSRVGMFFLAKLTAAQSRRDYVQRLIDLSRSGWDTEPDELLTVEDVQQAERLTPPITEAQAKELFIALRDSKFLLRGLPLISVESAEGIRTRIDL